MSLPLFAQMLDSKEEPNLPFEVMLSMMSLDFDGSTQDWATDVEYYNVEKYAEGFGSDGVQGEVEMYASVHRALSNLLKRKPDLSTCKQSFS